MAGSTPRSDSIRGTRSLQLPKKEGYDTLYYILMVLFIFALIGGIILSGGMLQLTLALFILVLIGFNLVYWSMEETEKTDIWKREGEFDEEVNLKLKNNSALVQRAFKGMELSQGYLEKKIRDLFLDKLMDKRNLSREETRELLEDLEEFREVVDDGIISDFILSKKEKDEESFTERLKGKDYERRISTLLKRIERWE